MSDNGNQPKWMIETRSLTRIYGKEVKIYALNDVNVQVAPGEFIAVMGPSGSGKSTLLNMIGALDIPTEGDVFVDGKNLRDIRNKDNFRAKTVGFVFQLHNLIPTLTARENVEIPMTGHANRRARRARSKELLEMVGLGDRSNHLPNQLSGGQRQRVAIARALANNPPLVLADEPTGSLDTQAGRDLIALIRELNQSQGTTILIVTHDPAIARQTDRVIVMEDGGVSRENIIGSPIEEDLRMWRHTGLGRRIAEGQTEELQEMIDSEVAFDALRKLLTQQKTEN